jgi:hypothetical protein
MLPTVYRKVLFDGPQGIRKVLFDGPQGIRTGRVWYSSYAETS